MARWVVFKITNPVNVAPYGSSVIWHAWLRPNVGAFGYPIGVAYGHIANVGGVPSSMEGNYEFLGVSDYPGLGWVASDNLELTRRCAGNDLKVMKLGSPNEAYIDNTRRGNTGLVSDWGWIVANNGAYKATSGLIYLHEDTVANQAPCSRKCDLQIVSINVVDNFGNYDIEVFTTTSFPSSTFSLDGVTYQADNKLNVSDEGIYTVWVKDANNCIQKQTVKVATGLGAYGPRYKATIRDNDNALWTAIIEELGYEGASEPVTVSSSSGIQVKSGKSGDNKNTAIKGSECSLMLNSETNMQFLSLFTGEVNKYRFRLIEGAFRNEVEHLTENSFLTYYTWFHVDWTGGDIAWETLTGNLRTTFVGSTNTTFKFFQLIPTISGLFRIKIRFKYTSTIADTMTIVVVLNDFDNDIGSGYEFEASTSTEWQTQEIEDTFGFDKLTLFAFYTGAPSATRELLIDYISIIPINEVAWSGMIAADAYEEPYMPAPYDVSFVFYDGLGKLKEIDLLNPQGDSFTGIKSQIQVVAIILAKTGLRLPINVAIDLFESKMNVGEGFTPLEQAFVNMDAFLKADGQPMDCYTSLEMLLTPYCAQVFQRDNEWWIVEVDINRTDSVNRSYDYYQFNEYGTKDSTKRTVTQLIEHTAADASTRIRFVNASQHMTVKPAYKQITIEQTTGVQITLNRNSKFADSGEEPQEFAYWTDETGLLSAKTVQEANNLVTQAYFEGDGLNTSFTKLFEAESVEVVVGAKGARIQVSINSRIVCGTSSAECKMRFKVSLGGYYLNSLGKWQTTEAFIDVVQNVNVFVKYDLTTEAIPNSGLLRIYMYQAYTSVTGVDVVGIEFKEVGVSYALIGSKIQEPLKTKLENDGSYNFVPANWKIGFGDIDHENAAYMFRNAIYTDAIGSRVSEKWFRRSYFETAPPSLPNGDFEDGLTGWDQIITGAGQDTWTATTLGDGDKVAMLEFAGSGDRVSKTIYQTCTNDAGALEFALDVLVEQDPSSNTVLVFAIGSELFQYELDGSLVGVENSIVKQIIAAENVEIAIQLFTDDSAAIVYIRQVTVANVTQASEDDETFLESLNGLPIQTTAAKKHINSYIRPIQLINGSLATKNARVKMGHIFRDSYNLNGTDFAIVSLKWDVAMCENEVELCEFEQTDITDDWLLDEVGNRILDENIRALTDEG